MTCLFALALTFVSGAIFGGGGISFEAKSDWKSLVEVGSFLATIVAALVAVWTMSAWRTQFRYSGKFNAIKDFQMALVGRSGLVSNYVWSIMEKREAVRNSGENDKDVDEVVRKMLEGKDALRTKNFEIETCWANLNEFLNAEELACLSSSPTYIVELVEDFAERAHRLDVYKVSMEFLELTEEAVVLCKKVSDYDDGLVFSSQRVLGRLIK